MRYEKRDPTRAEMILVRASHYLWSQLRAKSAPTVAQERAITAALEIVWEAKRQVKAGIKAKSAESFKRWVR